MENIDLDYQGIYVWYATVPVSTTISITSGDSGPVPLTTINVDSGGPVTGPAITLTGGASGLTFVASGSTITLTGSASGGGGFAEDFLLMGA